METTFNTEFIDSNIENQPYLDPFARGALEIWFEKNDSIKPVFEDRLEWEKREEILEMSDDENTNNKCTLYLPKDLNLFEMIDVVKAIDKETFKDNPELSTQGVEKIKKLAETFKKAGVYIDENIGYVNEGKDIAENLSKKFFNYGLSLESRTKKENEPISPTLLSESEKRELDKWLIGKERYHKVMSRLGPNPSQEDIDKERSRHFEGYFKALSKTGSKEEGDKPWERSLGPIARIHEKTEEGISRTLSQPETEIYGTAFRQGRKLLKEEMGIPHTPAKNLWEKLGKTLNKIFRVDHKKLYDYLEIPRLKEELKNVRSMGNIEEISKKEFEIATRIREEINTYQYRDSAHSPSEVIKDNYLNCLGSTLLGTTLLDEVGIKYLYVSPPEHAMTFLLTSDRKLYWQDFTPRWDPQNGMEIKGDLFEGNPDILTLAENSDSFNIVFKENSTPFNISNSVDSSMAALMHNLSTNLEKLGRYEEAIKTYKKGIELNPKDFGLYYNLGNTLNNLGRYEEAIKAYKKGIELNPKNFGLYYNLGNILNNLGRYEEAIKAYKKGIELNPNDSEIYYNLGNTLCNLGRYEEAIETYKKGIELNPNDSEIYYNLGNILNNLGRYEEAIETYKKGIELNPNDSEIYYNLGNTLCNLGRYEEAIETYKKGIELNPNDSRIYYNLGYTLRNLGRNEEAIEIAKKLKNKQ